MRRRRFTLFGFSVLFLIETWFSQGVQVEPFLWLQLIFAASMIGRAIAYLTIFEWLRIHFAIVVPHSSGAGEDNHPRYTEGIRGAVSELICCPVCAGTWGAAAMLMIYKLHPAFGQNLITGLSVAAGAWLLSYVTEWVEWHKHAARETTGMLNRNGSTAMPLPKFERGDES